MRAGKKGVRVGRTTKNAAIMRYRQPGMGMLRSAPMFVAVMPGLTIWWWISPWGATSSGMDEARPCSCASRVSFSSSEQMSSHWNLDAW